MSPILPIPFGMTRFDMKIPVWKWAEGPPVSVRRRARSPQTLHRAAHRSTAHPFTLERWGRARTRLSH